MVWTPTYADEVLKYASLQGNWQLYLNVNAPTLRKYNFRNVWLYWSNILRDFSVKILIIMRNLVCFNMIHHDVCFARWKIGFNVQYTFMYRFNLTRGSNKLAYLCKQLNNFAHDGEIPADKPVFEFCIQLTTVMKNVQWIEKGTVTIYNYIVYCNTYNI